MTNPYSPNNTTDPQPEPTPNPAPGRNPSPDPADRDTSSAQVAKVFGIPIRLHFTFLLLIVWIGFGAGGAGWAPLKLVLSIFVCVALHELGHALVGERFGIHTSSITLYPIGGVARIKERPQPRQELWIALAGPAVNLLIAAILFGVIVARGGPSAASSAMRVDPADWMRSLLQINVWLALFNLIPAFPMDGGRVLRAIVALSGQPIIRATNLAATIGQVLAIAFAVIPILVYHQVNWIWLFIAFFIYIGAGQEAQSVRQETLFTGVTVSKVMATNLETLVPGQSLREVADRLVHTTQQDFPVVMGDEVVGLMTRERLLRGLSNEGPDGYVAGSMIRDFNRADPARDLSDLLHASAAAGRTVGQSLPLLVLDKTGKLQGMVTSENLAEFFAIQQIMAMRTTRAT